MGRFSQPSKVKEQPNWLASALRVENFLPGFIVGFLLGVFVEIRKRSGLIPGRIPPSPSTDGTSKTKRGSGQSRAGIDAGELKMVFVVRQDLKMGEGKIASQCAHAAVGIYNDLLKRQPQLVWKWEQCGQPKIVVTCKNQQEMNELRTKAERVGLPTYTVADAGRTQVAAGSKTVLVVGPGTKSVVDSITRHLRLL